MSQSGHEHAPQQQYRHSINLVGERKQIVGDLDVQRLRSLEVDDHLELGRLLNRQVGGDAPRFPARPGDGGRSEP
jgi:hypothetical protein